ncbi:MAG: patatin-like phospholipase family protein [Verrucomicrobiota bacterium]
MKRILSLDGGGIRGVFTIAILERIEALLREHYKDSKPGLVLADYFDFIGGTSTGAIIAALLSKGLSVRAIRESYEQLGPIVFRRKPFWQSWRSFYGSEDFADLLRELFREKEEKGDGEWEYMTLGSKRLLTDLMIVVRNGSTGSMWPLTNNPVAKYNQKKSPEEETNLDIPLWQLVRASAAAPVFFPSEMVTLKRRDGKEQTFEFIDGGVSAYNNPSVAMFLHATLPVYHMNYPTGVDQLFLCSVGTGVLPLRFQPGELGKINIIGGALRTLGAMMESVTEEQDKLCRVLGDCIHGEHLDREALDLKGHGMKNFGYVRYQHEFTKEEIEASRRRTKSLRPLDIDDLAGLEDLLKIGRKYAEETVSPEHFPMD